MALKGHWRRKSKHVWCSPSPSPLIAMNLKIQKHHFLFLRLHPWIPKLTCWVFSYTRTHFSAFQCSLQFMWPISSDGMSCTTTSEVHIASGMGIFQSIGDHFCVALAFRGTFYGWWQDGRWESSVSQTVLCQVGFPEEHLALLLEEQ